MLDHSITNLLPFLRSFRTFSLMKLWIEIIDFDQRFL